MDTSRNSSLDDLDTLSDTSSTNTVVDVDLPPFEVIPRRLWVGKIVDMKNLSGVTIASGILRVLHAMDIDVQKAPWVKLMSLFKFRGLLFRKKHQTNGDTVSDPGELVKSSIMASVSSTTSSVIRLIR